MIPSLNDPKITEADFEPPKPAAWICDCCQSEFDQKGYQSCGTIYVPLFIEVKDVRYFSCSKECSRVLFNIHHQYAIREPDPKKRFSELWTPGFPEKTHFLDLDTVSRITVEEKEYSPHFMVEPHPPTPNDWVWLTWWTSDSTEKTQHGMPRFYATEVIEKWKARPTIVRREG